MSDATPISSMIPVPTDILTTSGSRFESRIHRADNAASSSRNGELKKAAQEFEAIFIAHMLKVMRETIEESGLTEGGFGKSIYTELFDQEISLSLARRGTLGISDLLERRLTAVAGPEENGEGDVSLPADPSGKTGNPAGTTPDKYISGHGLDEPISDMHLPVNAPVSSYYGMRRDPFTKQARFHRGMDLAAPEGTPVVPALPGTVISTGYDSGYGNSVLVEHAGGLRTRYGHLASINVKAGDNLTSENVLGTVGSTGRSTGPHLHFEVIQNGKTVDPTAKFAQYGMDYDARAGL